MSVLMILRTKADVGKFEEYARENGEQLKRIAEEGRSQGATHHAFFAGDGEIVVIDEWESEEKFQAFFSSQQEIPQVMQAAGAEGEPHVEFLRPVDTADKF
jgi:heme-degrading monooxygenase HmoA